MSVDINQVVLSGTINDSIREADVGDSHVVETELAFQVPGRDGPKEQWIQIQAWGERGEELARCAEGAQVLVSGQINRRAWKDKNDEWQTRYSIKVAQLQELGMGEPSDPRLPPAEPELDDDIPFK